jgi:hypothetical protein
MRVCDTSVSLDTSPSAQLDEILHILWAFEPSDFDHVVCRGVRYRLELAGCRNSAIDRGTDLGMKIGPHATG